VALTVNVSRGVKLVELKGLGIGRLRGSSTTQNRIWKFSEGGLRLHGQLLFGLKSVLKGVFPSLLFSSLRAFFQLSTVADEDGGKDSSGTLSRSLSWRIVPTPYHPFLIYGNYRAALVHVIR